MSSIIVLFIFSATFLPNFVTISLFLPPGLTSSFLRVPKLYFFEGILYWFEIHHESNIFSADQFYVLVQHFRPKLGAVVSAEDVNRPTQGCLTALDSVGAQPLHLASILPHCRSCNDVDLKFLRQQIAGLMQVIVPTH